MAVTRAEKKKKREERQRQTSATDQDHPMTEDASEESDSAEAADEGMNGNKLGTFKCTCQSIAAKKRKNHSQRSMIQNSMK